MNSRVRRKQRVGAKTPAEIQRQAVRIFRTERRNNGGQSTQRAYNAVNIARRYMNNTLRSGINTTQAFIYGRNNEKMKIKYQNYQSVPRRTYMGLANG